MGVDEVTATAATDRCDSVLYLGDGEPTGALWWRNAAQCALRQGHEGKHLCQHGAPAQRLEWTDDEAVGHERT